MYTQLVTQTIAWTENALTQTPIRHQYTFPVPISDENEVKHIISVGASSSWAQTLQKLPLDHSHPITGHVSLQGHSPNPAADTQSTFGNHRA